MLPRPLNSSSAQKRTQQLSRSLQCELENMSKSETFATTPGARKAYGFIHGRGLGILVSLLRVAAPRDSRT